MRGRAGSQVVALVSRARGELERPAGNLLMRFVALNIAGSLIASAIGFVASIGLARWLGPADRGLLGLMLSISTLTLVLTGFGVSWAVIYYESRSNIRSGQLFGNCLFHAALLAVVLVPAAWLLQGTLAAAFGHRRGGGAWVLVAVLVPITFLDWSTHGQLQGMLRFTRYNVLSVVAKLVYAAGVLILLGLLNLGVAAGLITTGLGSVVMIAGALGPILASGRPSFVPALYRAMLRYGSRVQIGSVFQTAMARLDVIILQFFRPLSQVGYYVVAQTIAELLLQFSGAFQSSVMPLVSQYEGDARQAMTSADSLRHYGLIGATATLANVVFGTAVILFAYGTSFHPAVVPMLVLLPGIWFLGMGGVIQGDLSGRGRPGLSSQLAGMAAVLTVVLDLALIPPFGVIGAAVASVIAYTAYGIASLLALHRVSGIPIRRLVVPTRADIATYRRLLRRAAARLLPSAGGTA